MTIEMVQLLLPFATMAVCVIALVWYRANRKWNKQPFNGILGFIDRNLVELILAAIPVPDLPGIFFKLFTLE